jgi:hypothetical protein
MKNMSELNYDQAHKFVETNKKFGFYWDGWNIVKWTPKNNAYTDVNGMFKNNKWGYITRYSLTKKGTWFIPSKYV